jgi:hypothetical protein
MTKKQMDYAIFWLPIVGGILLGGLAGNAWYGGNKILALWLGFAGLICFLLLGVLQLQQAIWRSGASERNTPNIAERQLRAYVTVDGAAISKFGGKEPPEFQVILKNTGQTPAYEIKGFTGVFMGDFPYRQTFPTVGGVQSFPSVLGAGSIMRGIVPTARSLSDAEIAAIKDGTGAIYGFGGVSYKDAFGDSHLTKYRFFFGGTAGARPDGLMMATEQGNSAD